MKESRLAESYNEKARRGQSFEADLSKYDTKQQDVIKKAVESGVLNNTNRTHEFVDMIAKISADKGVSFDFTNNEKLKTSGFAVDGKTVNGFVDGEGNITLNANSSKWLNSVVGHEITHILEGTELHTALQQTITEYAKIKGEYQSRYDALAELYEGVEGANIDNELTADLVGDYLFSDSDFINSLSTEQPNLFKKIYNEIKYLCKVATAGGKEARELEKVKKAFDNAWKEGGKAQKITTDKGDVKYSFGVSQSEINDYVEAAYAKENTEDYKKYAEPSERLLNDVANEIDIDGYSHALRDNDIRHIRNSHGEETNEKYPVTKDDIKLIPWIVENYDKVFVKTNAKNQPGIVYVKVMPDNIIYYVEAVTEEYHKEKLLINKQMLKAGIDEIPNLHGLIAAINKKTSSSQYLTDLEKIRKAYVRNVKENYSNDILSQNSEKSSEKEQYSLSDSDNSSKDVFGFVEKPVR